jgi:integrase
MKLPRFYQKHGAYYYVDTARKWHHLGSELEAATRRYFELRQHVTRLTLKDCFERFEREIIPQKKSPLTQRDYRAGLVFLTKAFGHFAPDELKPVHVYAYLDARAVKAKTRANREKALLSLVMSYAIRWDYITTNPCRDVKSFSEQPRVRYVTDEEFWRVHDHAPPGIQKAMLLALSTGLRLSDLLALTGQNSTVRGLLVQPAKTARSTGKVLLFGWTPGLRDLMGYPESGERLADADPVIVGDRGHAYTRSGFQSVWQRIMAKAIPNAEARFTFHDLRRKAGSDSSDGALLGHADKRTLNRHYRCKPELVDPLSFER